MLAPALAEPGAFFEAEERQGDGEGELFLELGGFDERGFEELLEGYGRLCVREFEAAWLGAEFPGLGRALEVFY